MAIITPNMIFISSDSNPPPSPNLSILHMLIEHWLYARGHILDTGESYNGVLSREDKEPDLIGLIF